MHGRYASIQLIGTGTLHLCEVHVFATDGSACYFLTKYFFYMIDVNATLWIFGFLQKSQKIDVLQKLRLTMRLLVSMGLVMNLPPTVEK